jgi:transcriptional regulator
MANGIVCFEMEVTELQGKKKLSQNKTLKEKQNIIESLSKSDDGPVRTLADYMQRNA